MFPQEEEGAMVGLSLFVDGSSPPPFVYVKIYYCYFAAATAIFAFTLGVLTSAQTTIKVYARPYLPASSASVTINHDLRHNQPRTQVKRKARTCRNSHRNCCHVMIILMSMLSKNTP